MQKIITLILLISLSSCSLMKVSVSTGEKPLSEQERQLRIATRAYYNKFSAEVTQASDSISEATSNNYYKRNAVMWKLSSTAAIAEGVYQSSADVALVNIWITTIQMNNMIKQHPDGELFGSKTPVAANTSSYLLDYIERIASNHTSSQKYTKLKEFATNYATENPARPFDLPKINIANELTEYLKNNKEGINTNTGLISEALSDMSDRMSGMGSQAINEMKWQGELLKMDMQQDKSLNGLIARSDSLMLTLNNMGAMLSRSPEIADSLSKRIGIEVAVMIAAFDTSVNNAFFNISHQRVELQDFINLQRQQLAAEADTAVQNAIKTAMDSLPALIGKLLFYIVGAILLLLIPPFAAGYFIGKARASRAKKRNKLDE